MRTLKDIDIIRWNKIFIKSPYHISLGDWVVNSNKMAPTPMLKIFKKSDFKELKDDDPIINYNFKFSVIKHRKDELFNIFEKLIKEGITNSLYCGLTSDDKSKYKEIDLLVDKKESTMDHSINNREYIKYDYDLTGKLTSIIGYLTLLEDAIEFYQKIWGYSEDGSEIKLIKYPIGSIVSLLPDKSTDYLVVDYDYFYDNISKDCYKIRYLISKMIYDESPVIKYDKSILSNEYELSYSRNDRIKNILN